MKKKERIQNQTWEESQRKIYTLTCAQGAEERKREREIEQRNIKAEQRLMDILFDCQVLVSFLFFVFFSLVVLFGEQSFVL